MLMIVFSPRAITGRMPILAAASMSGWLGYENRTSTPSSFRIRARASTPRIVRTPPEYQQRLLQHARRRLLPARSDCYPTDAHATPQSWPRGTSGFSGHDAGRLRAVELGSHQARRFRTRRQRRWADDAASAG